MDFPQLKVSTSTRFNAKDSAVKSRAYRPKAFRAASRSDGLTGLFNRAYFDECLDAEVKRAQRDDLPISLLIVEIDNLKEYEISSDIEFLSEMILKQIKKQKSPVLLKMRDSIVRLAYYFLESKNERRLYQEALSDYKLRKNRAILRARKAEEENEKIRRQSKSSSN